MYKMTIRIFMVLLTFASLSTVDPAIAASRQDDGEEMDAVVKAVHDALQQSQNVKVEGFPSLAAVKLELNTVVTKTGGGKIKFFIFSFGKTKSSESSSTISVELSVPRAQGTPSSTPPDPNKIAEALAGAIVQAKESFVAASRIDPRLTQSKVTLAIKFVVKSQTGGGVVIVPIGLEASGDITKSNVHLISLTFQ